MGYGSRAMELLYRFYNGEMIALTNINNDDNDEESDHEADKGDDDSEGDDDEPASGCVVFTAKS